MLGRKFEKRNIIFFERGHFELKLMDDFNQPKKLTKVKVNISSKAIFAKWW